MELRQLRYFATLAETLNFSRAADRLNMSQPPLTVAIRRLEDELGAPLFIRHSRGVSLTSAGEAALEFARGALAAADRVREAVREDSTGSRGRLTLGFVGSAGTSLLPSLLTAFRKRYPLVDLILEETTSVEIARQLRTRQLDVGLVRLPLLDRTHVTVDVIETDELVAALPSEHRLAREPKLALGDLSSDAFILFSRVSILHTTVLVACRDAGFTPVVAQEATQVHTILSIVQGGLGVALVPSRSARHMPDGVKVVELAQPPRIELGLAIPRHNPSTTARNFRTVAIGQP